MQRLSFGARIRAWGLSAVIVTGLFVITTSTNILSQDMQNMPGMKMPKAKSTAGARKTSPKKRRQARKKPSVKKHDIRRQVSSSRRKRPAPKTPANRDQMGNMPGMNMPAQPAPPATPSTARPASQPMDMNMPGMPMPQASPSASPQMEMSMPGKQASPSASPQTQTNMPGMQMPAASPNPKASPEQKMDPNMPMPAASPSASTMGQMPGMPGMETANPGSLLVMSGNDMGVRVGPSEKNVMYVGQMGSGTSWAPSSTQTRMWDKIAGNWLLMLHFNAFAGVNAQGGPRGVTKIEAQNWIMPMAFHKLGRGTLQLRGMFSLEPFTFPPGGSPLLFQTGETYKGRPLIDRQHPHDLFMELSAQYTLALGERGTWYTYFGYPGEPALGPPAFMHRESASENPSATLAHHLQDSQHISFGVLTTGFTYRWFKLEGSIFNGREPDENRYNFDAHKWNSRSVRLTLSPNKNWAIQVSHGLLRSPEAAEPTTDIRRTTASVQYNRPINRGNWATAFVWGRNHTSSPGETHNLNGYTFESTVNFLDKNYFYTRLELVDKNELLRPADRALLGIKDDHPSFRIGAYTFGGVRDIWDTKKLSMGIGSDLTFYSKPSILDPIYGSHPVSWKLFLRLRPSRMDMSAHSLHGNMNGEPKPPNP